MAGLLKIAYKSKILLSSNLRFNLFVNLFSFSLHRILISFQSWLDIDLIDMRLCTSFFSKKKRKKALFVDNFANIHLKTKVHKLRSTRPMISSKNDNLFWKEKTKQKNYKFQKYWIQYLVII